LIAPLQTEALLKELEGVDKVLVVEQSHGAQFMAWLRAHVDFPCAHQSLAIPGPLPIRPIHILNAFTQWEENALEVEHVANC
jgi:2-oxoglutarate ferredoxin oxidoreductase subunit alpha